MRKVSTCIQLDLNISSVDRIVIWGHTIDILGFLGWSWNSVYTQEFLWIHQIQLSRDHQELAYTWEGPPWRISMTEMNFRTFYWNIDWVIDKMVWKPTLATPIFFAGIIILLMAVNGW